ncbi:MAG: DUF1330 domain-containing protein [Alphaproteobacteria bacterium]|nr:DUF1330 domain-containing protein [Alphaproteobacteria bacterium]
MPAYWIGMLSVTNPDKFKGYADRAPAAIAKFGGKMLSRGGQLTNLEGAPPPGRIAIIEFKDVATAKACYDSPEYQEAKRQREGAATAQFFIVEGL